MPERDSLDSLTPVSAPLPNQIPPNAVHPGGAVDAVAEGGEYLDPAFTKRLIEHMHRAKKAALNEEKE